MTVLWMEQAQESLGQANRYIRKEYGRKASENFILKMYKVGRLLADNPYMGSVEPLLENSKITYRSIVENRIEIADVWDTRREPRPQADKIK